MNFITDVANSALTGATDVANTAYTGASTAISGVASVFHYAPQTDKVILLIIDPQNDFHEGGSLAVPGALKDSERTADMIVQHAEEIDEIYITLDSHHVNHIAHAVFWVDAEGNRPAPFTIITYDDVVKGVWTPRNKNHLEWCKEYTLKLKVNDRFNLCIWPEHCLIGSKGQAVVDVLHSALQYWEYKRQKEVHYVTKGENSLTEMYSAIAADVEVDSDPRTKMNPALMSELTSAKRLLICGQAKSHCVAFTTRDILKYWQDGTESRIVLLEDATSPVQHFEAKAAEFMDEITERGVTVANTTDVFSTVIN